MDFSDAARKLLEFACGDRHDGFFVGGDDDSLPALDELRTLGLCSTASACDGHPVNRSWTYAAELTPRGFAVADTIYDQG